MAASNKLEIILISMASFATGLAVGMLMAPKSGRESREWLQDQADQAVDWLDEKGHEAVHNTSEKLRQVKETIPDLYSATEDLDLDDDDLLTESHA
ncbi:MAG TPA: YtxH domain-containing protein [Balneolales bacterium]|nr:YtxH domain-containing protein [Balneolales bacterium]